MGGRGGESSPHVPFRGDSRLAATVCPSRAHPRKRGNGEKKAKPGDRLGAGLLAQGDFPRLPGLIQRPVAPCEKFSPLTAARPRRSQHLTSEAPHRASLRSNQRLHQPNRTSKRMPPEVGITYAGKGHTATVKFCRIGNAFETADEHR